MLGRCCTLDALCRVGATAVRYVKQDAVSYQGITDDDKQFPGSVALTSEFSAVYPQESLGPAVAQPHRTSAEGRLVPYSIVVGTDSRVRFLHKFRSGAPEIVETGPEALVTVDEESIGLMR